MPIRRAHLALPLLLLATAIGACGEQDVPTAPAATPVAAAAQEPSALDGVAGPTRAQRAALKPVKPTPTATASPPPAATAAAPEASEAQPAVEQTKAAGFDGDGTFLVGSEVQPGTYRSEATKGGLCYWSRLKNLSENGIIDNSVSDAGPVLVRVKSSDYAIEVSDCKPFTRIGD